MVISIKQHQLNNLLMHLIRYLLHHSPIPQVNLHDKYMFPDLHNVLHGKLRDLQEHGFGEKSDSISINS